MKETDRFEFCKVCRLSHDQGHRHKYFPNHVKSLSSFLSRFQQKLSDVRFFLKNPSTLRPEHASRNRIWCVFCDSDIDEVGSSFACGNAINHFAGADHLKNLKSFLWTFGGKMDQVDSFRVLEADLAKWENNCKLLKSGAASEGSCRPLIGPSNDIHNELKSESVDSFEKNTNYFLRSSFSNCVMPLQNYTNERYQIYHSELSEVTGIDRPDQDANLYFPVGTCLDANPWVSNSFAGCTDTQQSLVCNGKKCTTDGFFSNEGAHPDERMVYRGSGSQGFHNLSQISPIVQGNEGNVHTGAPPPWFDSTENTRPTIGLKPESRSRIVASSLKKIGKSQKLNPKRVGAAWAEKRKMELEMEKRGEIITNNFDDNWLPNFGRVWQSGTRKESKKEFETGNTHSLNSEPQSETVVKIQPYVSKRMRTDASNDA